MRLALAVTACAAACGGRSASDAAIGGSDAPLARCATPAPGSTVTFRKIGRVGGSATLATSPPGDDRLFVLEQNGAIRIFDATGALLDAPFVDLSEDADGPVRCCGEMGLLGLAFHPQYAANGTFFVFYTTRIGGNPLRDVLARCRRSATDPNLADKASCVEVLSIPDFASNHNGGMIEFGKDGFLYISTGDGGGAGDPNRNGQALVDSGSSVALLGKMLRIDVDRKAPGKEYGVPADNPFAAGGGAPEIFIIGLRNVWRWSFDRETGDMWLADVGQDRYEEITALRPAQQRGANLGWSKFEGTTCFRPPDCATDGLVMPQDVRTHADGWLSVTGGQVYRGSCYADLVGWYFYTDYSKHGLSRARLNADDTLTVEDLPGTFPQVPSSLHEDAAGELYLTDTQGNVYHLEAGP
ncbi:MAG: PQQ-dependent sugar dehydrogenase [Deltaproteobacteria bacterium]|nr:PQQ-dependent sugar dehydrogenase [Deltaproteobacteria bacterium]